VKKGKEEEERGEEEEEEEKEGRVIQRGFGRAGRFSKRETRDGSLGLRAEANWRVGVENRHERWSCAVTTSSSRTLIIKLFSSSI
jgi:hypothetical protein